MHVESVVWIAERKDMLSTFLGLLTLLVYVRYSRKAVLASDSLIVFVVLAVLTWAFTLIGMNCIRAGHPEDFNAWALLIYVPIFLGITIYGAVVRRYYLILYCVIFVLYVLGLLAKPMLVTLPCVCLLLDFWPLGRFSSLFSDAPLQAALVERPAVPRRKAKRNQRLPARKAAVPAERAMEWTGGAQILLLLLEKVPLLALSAASAIITPYAQNHGGSMASTSELSLGFRLENSLQSYMRYITRMFWPGKMSVLYLLDPDHVDHFYTAIAVVTLLTITGLVIWAAFYGRRYLAFGWFWYLGTLVPVIGIVQVGEQTHADRYTYIPYVGLFVMLAWGIADLINLLPQFRTGLRYATGIAMILVLAICVGWTKYQLQFWTGVEVHLRHALTITPDNWNMLNNLGVYLWKEAQKQDAVAAKAEADGDLTSAAEFHARSVALKDDATAQWIHGITARPTATDIHSNLGYRYSESGDLDKAEWHLTQAVKLKPISPRPHNNLGRVLLRRSQKCEADAREADAKHETEKAKRLRSEAKVKLDAAIAEFDTAVGYDPSLLEARLNLGEVYLSPSALHPEKAEFHFLKILDSTRPRSRTARPSITSARPISAWPESSITPQQFGRRHQISDPGAATQSPKSGGDAVACRPAIRAGRVSRGRKMPLAHAGRDAGAEAGGIRCAILRTIRQRPQSPASRRGLEFLRLGVCHESRAEDPRSQRGDDTCPGCRDEDATERPAVGGLVRRGTGPQRPVPAGRASGPNRRQSGQFPGQQAAGRCRFAAFAVLSAG